MKGETKIKLEPFAYGAFAENWTFNFGTRWL